MECYPLSNEGKKRGYWSYHRMLQDLQKSERVTTTYPQKQRFEERARDESRHEARNGEADGHVFPHHIPLHLVAHPYVLPPGPAPNELLPVGDIFGVITLSAGFLFGVLDELLGLREPDKEPRDEDEHEETNDEGYRVSHRIYGNFKNTLGGRTLSWLMVSCFGMLQSAAEHTLVELEYFKEQLEA